MLEGHPQMSMANSSGENDSLAEAPEPGRERYASNSRERFVACLCVCVCVFVCVCGGVHLLAISPQGRSSSVPVLLSLLGMREKEQIFMETPLPAEFPSASYSPDPGEATRPEYSQKEPGAETL